MSHTSANTTAFIEAQQYSSFILTNLPDGMLPEGFYRDVSDFGSGTTLNIKSVGSATIQDVAENVPMTYNPIDTGTVSLSITEFTGDAWYITDVLREDGAQVESLSAARAQESTRAIQEDFETKFLKVCGDGTAGAQTVNNANNVNGFPHRFTGSGANNTITLGDIQAMTLSFNKANVPMAGRVAIIDPVVATTLSSLAISGTVSQNQPVWQSILENGWEMNHNFVINIFGWDVWTSNRLFVTEVEEAALVSGDGTAAPIASLGNVANVFMCILDDNTKPIMCAWRRMPKAEGQRNVTLKRDEFDVTCRFGFGAQRIDTLGVILTSATAIA